MANSEGSGRFTGRAGEAEKKTDLEKAEEMIRAAVKRWADQDKRPATISLDAQMLQAEIKERANGMAVSIGHLQENLKVELARRSREAAPGRTVLAQTEQEHTKAFVDQHMDELRYSGAHGKWFWWDGARWKLDTLQRHMFIAFEYSKEIAIQAVRDDNKAVMKFSTRNQFATNIWKAAMADSRIAAAPEDFDADDYLLNTPDGIWNLKTGERMPNNPARMMSMITEVAPDFEMKTPVFDKFIDETLGKAKKNFVLNRLALCLSGDVSSEQFDIWYGVGGNGKGALIRTITHLMGDYAGSAADSAFVTDDGARVAHPTELAELSGKRLVTVNETDKGQSFRLARIKDITGNERPIRVRFMHRDFFDLIVKFKLIVVTNDKPKLREVKADDPAIKRRMNVVSFDNIVESDDADEKLKKKLEAEAPGILAMLIERAKVVLEKGIKRPLHVRVAASEYMAAEDEFGEFYKAGLVWSEGSSLPLTDVTKAYKRWALDNGAGETQVSSQWIRSNIQRTPGLMENLSTQGNNRFLKNYRVADDLRKSMNEAAEAARQQNQVIVKKDYTEDK